jgi:phosphatidylglycerol:prolipoprotein diacylglycerol transferase
MTFSSPGKYLINNEFLQIRMYGLMYAIAFLSCIAVASFIVKRNFRKNSYSFKQPDIDEINDLTLWLIIFGLLGARLWYVILDYKYFMQHPSEILQIWLGGQSIQGAIVGGLIGLWIYASLIKKYSWGRFEFALGIGSCILHLGQAIGRWGNFFNEEAFGPVTDLPWRLYISHTGMYHHPTFLYESVFNLLNFFILLFFSSKLRGLKLFGLYLINYSVIRIFLEQLRTDSLYIGSIKAATLVSAVGIVVGAVMFLAAGKVRD